MLPILVSLASLVLSILLAIAATSILGGITKSILLNLRGQVDGEAAAMAREAQQLDLGLARDLAMPGDSPRALVDGWQAARSALGVRQGSGKDWDFTDRDLAKWRESETQRRSKERQDLHRVICSVIWCVVLILAMGSAISGFLLLGNRYAG